MVGPDYDNEFGRELLNPRPDFAKRGRNFLGDLSAGVVDILKWRVRRAEGEHRHDLALQKLDMEIVEGGRIFELRPMAAISHQRESRIRNEPCDPLANFDCRGRVLISPEH
jgi:hypothetical protein